MAIHGKDLEFKPMKLKYCVNCGQKQHSAIQKFCSNCGTAYDKPDFDVEQTDDVKEKITDKNVARGVGGILILPYLGFYSSVLIGLLVLLHGDYSNSLQVFLRLFVGFGLMITGIASIILIHQKRKAFLGWVVALYLFNLLEAIDYAVINNSPTIILGTVIGLVVWLIYFGSSRRVKQVLGINHSGSLVTNAGWKTTLTVVLSVLSVIIVIIAVAASVQSNNSQTTASSVQATNLTALNSCIDNVDNWFGQTATTNGVALALLSNKQEQVAECQSQYRVTTSSNYQAQYNYCISNVDNWWVRAAPTVGLANYLLPEKQQMVTECQARYPI